MSRPNEKLTRVVGWSLIGWPLVALMLWAGGKIGYGQALMWGACGALVLISILIGVALLYRDNGSEG